MDSIGVMMTIHVLLAQMLLKIAYFVIQTSTATFVKTHLFQVKEHVITHIYQAVKSLAVKDQISVLNVRKDMDLTMNKLNVILVRTLILFVLNAKQQLVELINAHYVSIQQC